MSKDFGCYYQYGITAFINERNANRVYCIRDGEVQLHKTTGWRESYSSYPGAHLALATKGQLPECCPDRALWGDGVLCAEWFFDYADLDGEPQ